MRKNFFLLVIYFACPLFFVQGFSQKNLGERKDILPASALHVCGRYDITAEGHLELVSSASYAGFSFKGSECRIYVHISDPLGHNYLQYELDGLYQKRIRIDGAKRDTIIIWASGNGTHSIWMYKATEAHTGPVFIEKISGKALQPLRLPGLPLIEFIGNSITCGAAADPSEIPCGAGVYHDQHNAYYAYGPRVARALHCRFMLSSVSGIGIYRNWNSDGPAMPLVYEKTDFQEMGQRFWNFNTLQPDVVSIALGTNDLSNGDGKKARPPFDSASFVQHYIEFVKLVKSKYPGKQIALLSSPMINGERRELLQHCILEVKNATDLAFRGDKPVAVYFFRPMTARGCSGHPSVEDHALLAEELVPFFKSILTR